MKVVPARESCFVERDIRKSLSACYDKNTITSPFSNHHSSYTTPSPAPRSPVYDGIITSSTPYFGKVKFARRRQRRCQEKAPSVAGTAQDQHPSVSRPPLARLDTAIASQNINIDPRSQHVLIWLFLRDGRSFIPSPAPAVMTGKRKRGTANNPTKTNKRKKRGELTLLEVWHCPGANNTPLCHEMICARTSCLRPS